jgi:hypothetical protein
LLRLTNFSDRSGVIVIEGLNDSGDYTDPVNLTLGSGESVQLRSVDVESGSPAKGLDSGIGNGNGNWRLRLSSSLDFAPLAFIRTPSGFLTSIHEVAQGGDTLHVLPIVNPGSNTNQVSVIRIVNNAFAETSVTITGVDDAGEQSGTVSLNLGKREAIELSALELETGGKPGVSGALGDGTGKWRLTVRSSDRVGVLSLLEDPNGFLNNWSTQMPRARGPVGLYVDTNASGILGGGDAFAVLTPENEFYLLHHDTGNSFAGEYVDRLGKLSIDARSTSPETRELSVADSIEATLGADKELDVMASIDNGFLRSGFAGKLSYSNSLDRGAELNRLVGAHSGSNAYHGYTMTVRSNGEFSASEGSGCGFSGRLRAGNPALGLFYASGTFTCSSTGQTTLKGVVTLVPGSNYGETDRVLAMFRSTQTGVSIGMIMTKQ